ncbi:MAG: hypothetical protein V3U27_02330 [Candidatus Tectomicrobia bacterium]
MTVPRRQAYNGAEAVHMLLERPLSAEAKRKIRWDNAVQLYGERVVA